MADADDDVVGLGRAEPGARRADHHDRRAAGQGVQAQGLGERSHHGAGLAGAGRADGEQGGAEQVGAEGEAGATVVVGVAGVVGGGAEPDLSGEQVVAGVPGRQVALPGGVQAGGGAVLQYGAGEGGQAVPAGPHPLPGPADPRVIHIPHEPGLRLTGKPLGSLRRPGLPQLRPFGGVLFGGGLVLGRGRGGTPGARPVAAPDLAPAAQAADDEQDGEGDDCVVRVPEDGVADGIVALAPGVGGEQLQRQHPPGAEVAVPQQGPHEPAHEKGDQCAAEQLPGRDLLGLLLGPGPVPEAPHARRCLRAGGPQPGEEDGAVRFRWGAGRHRGRRRHPGWHGRYPRPLRRRHRAR